MLTSQESSKAGAVPDVIEIVFEWVDWYNNGRLHSALEHQTPEEYEQTYYARQIGSLPDDAANKMAA
ncbi:MAG: IS3 family transposase [Specibacter sp.]